MAFEKLANVKIGEALGSLVDGTNSGITLIATSGTITLGSGANGSSIGTCGDNAQGVPYVGLVCKSGSLVAGCKITNVKMDLYRHHQTGSTSAPTTALQARIIRGSDDAVQETATSSTTFANLPTSSPSSPNVTFTFSGNYEIQVGDRIVLYYNWSNAEWYAKMDRQSGSGFVDQYVYQQSGSWDSGSSGLQPHMEITHTTNSNIKLGTGCYSFDGSNDYVECGTTGTFNFLHTPNTKFTICGWFKRSTAEANSLETLLTTFNNGVSSASGIRIMYDDRSGESCDRSMRFNWQGNATDLNNETITHQVFPNDTDWHHLTVTGDLTTTTDAFKIYIDGTLKFSPNLTGTPIDEDHNIALRFGVEGDGTDYGNWNLDDWGFFNRVLTATEISDLVNKTGATDGIGAEGDLTNSGTITYNAGLVGKCIHCDFAGTEGTGSGAPTGTFFRQANSNNNDFNFIHTAGQTWTVNFWIKGDSANLDRVSQLIGNTSSGVSGGVKGFYINILDRRTQYSEQNRVHTSVQNGGAVYVNWNGTDGDLPDDTNWHMITMRCNGTQVNGAKGVITHVDGGTSNNFTDEIMYMNRNTSVTGSATNASNGLMFGRNLANPYNDYYHWDGSFDEVSIWNRELTDAECVALYNDGDGAVTTTAVTNHSELKAYWNFNDQMKNQASPVLTGALVSSLSKANLKAYYSMNSTSLGLTPTKETLDSTNGTTDWAEVGSRYTIDTSNNQIDFALVRDNSGYGITTALYDLGASSMLNDTEFVLRYRLNFGTIDNPSRTPSVQFVFGAYSNTDGISDTQDCITMFCGATSNTGNNLQFGVTDNSGAYSQNPNVTFDASGTGVTGNNNWYVEMVRTSASAGVARLYSDSTYETLVQEKSLAFSSSNPQNLRYIGAKFFGSNSTATPTYNGYMSDVKIYNGVSSLDGCKNDDIIEEGELIPAKTLSTGTFSAKKHLMIQMNVNPSGNASNYIRFNGDETNKYCFRRAEDGGSATSLINKSGVYWERDYTEQGFATISLLNISSKEKLGIMNSMTHNGDGSGSSNVPKRGEIVFKWTGTDQITKIELVNVGQTGNYGEGTEIAVYGTD